MVLTQSHPDGAVAKASANRKGGFNKGAILEAASTLPSCPQAAIPSSPLLSRTVHTAPALLRMSPNAAICMGKSHQAITPSHAPWAPSSTLLKHWTRLVFDLRGTISSLCQVIDYCCTSNRMLWQSLHSPTASSGGMQRLYIVFR